MINENLKRNLDLYIKNNYIPRRITRPIIIKKAVGELRKNDLSECLESSRRANDELCIDDIDIKVENSFQMALFKLIDEKNISEPDLYNKCFIDRKLFSKIRSDEEYKPSKKTAILLCLGLELEIDMALYLLSKAGYTLSKSIKFDVIIRYFFENRIYDVRLINDTLYNYEQALLVNF